MVDLERQSTLKDGRPKTTEVGKNRSTMFRKVTAFVLFNPYLCEDFCNAPNSRSLSFPREYFLLDADLKNEMIPYIIF